MAGSSCLNCIFSQWEGQSQNGCALRRLDKYETGTIINDDFTGTYFVTLHSICPAKRTKSWLTKNPRDPVIQVRKELYPKLQLILLIDECSQDWIDFLDRTDFSKYTVVDILVFNPDSKFIQTVVSYNKFNVHVCFPVENSLCSNKEHHINHFVRKDCQFYILVDYVANDYVSEWPDRLDSYLNDKCKPLYMAYDNEDNLYNNRLIYTPLHIMFGGFGSQSIYEKITNHCSNNDSWDLIQYFGDIWYE
jgi:hypothetical protein